MNYLVTLYCPDTDTYYYHTLFGEEGDVSALAENLSRMLSDRTELFWDVFETAMVDNIYPIESRFK